jgi:soluble lytic murein transglycosylase
VVARRRARRPPAGGGRPLILRAILVLAALAGGGALGWRQAGPPDLSRWRPAIDRAAAEAGVDPALLAALVAVESGGRPEARSVRGARGLLQLLPDTAREQAERMGLEAADPTAFLDPETNLRLGAGYLARLLRRYAGEVPFALAAYNAGPTRVDRWRRRAPHLPALEVVLREGFEETRKHVTRVLAWRGAY